MSDYKQAILKDFNHRRGESDFHKRLASRLVELANITEGSVVLDVATGTGLAAIAAAKMVGPNGHVLGTDFATGMLQQARSKATDLSLQNIKFEVADADEQILVENQFDTILCSSAIVYFTHISSVLQHWNQGLKSKGTVAFSCFQETSPSAGVLFREVVEDYGISIPNPNYSLGTEQRCRQKLESAGFENIEIVIEQFGAYLPNGKRAWAGNENSAFGLQNVDWSAEQLERCRQAYLSAIAAASNEDGYWNDMTAFFITAQTP